MLSWGALLGECAQYGVTPLYTACHNGQMKVVKLLLEHADVAVNQAELEVRGRREGSAMWGWR